MLVPTPTPRPAILLAALVLLIEPARSFAVTGTLGGSYGPPLAVQASQSNVGGNTQPYAQMNESGESQLVAAYGTIDNGTLRLFFSGNLTFWIQLEGGISHWLPIDVFIDDVAGGQHQLLANNPTPDPSYDLNKVAGLTFDTGFAADYWLSLGGNTPAFQYPRLQAYYATLPTGGAGSGNFLGETLPGPPGTLAGGANPNGIQVTLDDSNQPGIGNGCGVPAPVAATTGIEWAIPLAAIGDPTGCIRVSAWIAGSPDHAWVSNQVMGPIPPGSCGATPAAATDFSAVPGDQFFTVCPSATPARAATWGRVKAIYR